MPAVTELERPKGVATVIGEMAAGGKGYKTLLGELDADQTAKAKAMQRAWMSYRDTTCQFYDDKIRGSMSLLMHAACVTRETARRAMLLSFFSRL